MENKKVWEIQWKGQVYEFEAPCQFTEDGALDICSICRHCPLVQDADNPPFNPAYGYPCDYCEASATMLHYEGY